MNRVTNWPHFFVLLATVVCVANIQLSSAVGDDVALSAPSYIEQTDSQKPIARKSSRRQEAPPVEQKVADGVYARTAFVTPQPALGTSQKTDLAKTELDPDQFEVEVPIPKVNQGTAPPQEPKKLFASAQTKTPFMSRRSPNRNDAPGFDRQQIFKYVVPIAAVLLGVLVISSAQQNRFRKQSTTSELELISSLRIAPRCCVTIIRANDHRFLVARDATGIRSVVPLEENTFPDVQTLASLERT